jgi:hypothetical protein
MQDLNFREVRRITNMLLMLKRNQRNVDAWAQDEAEVEGLEDAKKIEAIQKVERL